VHHADGSSRTLELAASAAVVREGEWYEMRMASGGGYGDPLDREAAAVERDVAHGRMDAEVARRSYGVVVGDGAATAALRDATRRDRLTRAQPARKPLSSGSVDISGDALPIYPGVIQRGAIAVAEASGAPLAHAPETRKIPTFSIARGWIRGAGARCMSRRWSAMPNAASRLPRPDGSMPRRESMRGGAL
jgi:hypothetical protein